MTNDRLTGLAFILAILISFLALAMDNANATNGGYGYTPKHHASIKCPYYNCHKQFRHK